MSVIEVDGVESKPLTVDSIQIFAAQRYSFVLAANQTVGNYWIRVNPNIGSTGITGGINSAILRYVGAPVAEPTTSNTPNSAPLQETSLHPLKVSGVPGQPTSGGVDLALSLVLSFSAGFFFINGHSFVPPTVPVLLQILNGTQNAQDLLPNGSVIALPGNSVIEISLPIPTGDIAGLPHPFHLHGYNFHVVRSAGSSTYNYVDPILRDIVSPGAAGDNVTIRFVRTTQVLGSSTVTSISTSKLGSPLCSVKISRIRSWLTLSLRLGMTCVLLTTHLIQVTIKH